MYCNNTESENLGYYKWSVMRDLEQKASSQVEEKAGN